MNAFVTNLLKMDTDSWAGDENEYKYHYASAHVFQFLWYPDPETYDTRVPNQNKHLARSAQLWQHYKKLITTITIYPPPLINVAHTFAAGVNNNCGSII